jgi:hypothetical protein
VRDTCRLAARGVEDLLVPRCRLPPTLVAPILSLCVLAFLAGCDLGGSGSTEGASTRSGSVATMTGPTGSTGTNALVPPPRLAHRQFIHRLNRICKTLNRQLERRFGAALDAAVAANDYERLANLSQRARRLDRPFYSAIRELGRMVPERDEHGLRRYLALSHQLDIFEWRYIKALRAHDDDELGRLNLLIKHGRNRRTHMMAKMGPRECGR